MVSPTGIQSPGAATVQSAVEQTAIGNHSGTGHDPILNDNVIIRIAGVAKSVRTTGSFSP